MLSIPPKSLGIVVSSISFLCASAPTWAGDDPGAAPCVVINEVHYDADPKTERAEFVELLNAGNASADLSGWQLEGLGVYIFPGGTSLDPGEFLVLAEDAATMQSKFGVSTTHEYTGSLSNDGDDLRLSDATGLEIDRVNYGAGFPWPTAARGEGPSMELIHPELDNDLGGSWRSSVPPDVLPELVLLQAADTGWRWRDGTSEASSPVEDWREEDFAEDGTWNPAPLPIGYGGVSGMTHATVVTGMVGSYTSLFLRNEFVIAPGEVPSALVLRFMLDDGIVVWINGVEVHRENLPGGDLSIDDSADGNYTEGVWIEKTLGGTGYLVEGSNTISVHLFNSGTGSSDVGLDLEVIRPAIGLDDPAVPTPGALNSVYTSNAPPQLRQVEHTPQQPTSGLDVVISAKVTDPDGVDSVTLSYQLVDPGAYINLEDASYDTDWTDLPMVDDGTTGDAVLGDAVFSVTMPGNLQTHRRLVRYRITVQDLPGVSVQVPYADDESPNFAYFCYDGVPDWTASKQPGVSPEVTYPAAALDSIAVYHLISKESDVIACQWTGPNDGVYRYLGTWVYDGKVYDHMRYRIRGNASTRKVGRNKWKFNFANAHPLEARDNYGKKYKVAWDKINVLPGSNPWWRNNASTEGTMFCESLGFRAYQISGGIGCNTHFFHFRVIDDSDEAPAGDQYGGDFWGMYIAIEQPEAKFLNERGLPDGNIYNVHGGSGSSLRNQGATQVSDKSDLFAFQGLHNSSTSQAQWEANLDFEDYFAFNAMNLAINNSDMRNQENVNYYHNSATDKWHTLPWDLDLTFEDAPHLGRGDTAQWERIYNCLQYPEINQAYENQVRGILDLFLDDDQAAHLTNEFAGFMTKGGADNLVEASQAMWDYHPRKIKKGIWYANFNSSLLPNRTFADLTQYTKDFLTVGGYGRDKLAAKQSDSAIPNQPTISYSGDAGFQTDTLTFTSSPFSDPQGAGTFGSMEWRVGQIHNASTAGYIVGDRYVYEAETFYQTDRMTPFNSTFTFLGGASGVRVGSTYRARVRHIDSSGRASHWSEPVEFTAGEPDVTRYLDGLVISEIMYNPAGDDSLEFVEIMNIGATTLDLSPLRFTKGIDFDFAGSAITSVAAGARVLVVKNQAAFEAAYGNALAVAGEYQFSTSNSLSNGGERLKLSFGAGTAIRDFDYDEDAPWPTSPDGGGPSLVLIDPAGNPDHTVAANWRPSTTTGGNPGISDASAPFSGNPGLDGDSDGRNAFMEHAMGSSDSSPDPGSGHSVGICLCDDGTGTERHFLTISYRRNLAADDVVFEVQNGTDFSTWSALGTVYVSAIYNGDGTETVTYRSALPLASIPREFLRLAMRPR